MTYVRLTTFQADPSKVEAGIRVIREQSLAIVRQQPGFEGVRLLVDRASGKMVAAVLWANEAAARASDSALSPSRGQVAQVVGAPTPTVETFEMVINESVIATPA
jgi:hypothetical protein